ncbi:Uncharacterized protein TCM_008874 [Theobroma cacao]|uniref:APS kinase domain-containing protein n=1 Tax=Theobroma cacao TaxID=3641 RepID=A0A061E6A8_THECC|nr:Uncharacterized protein TCM_008874 [Theobroma cacao]
MVLIFILFMFFSKLNCPLHVQVFMNMPLELCKARDSKSCLKLARAGKIKGFTSIDNPYEPPQNCEDNILSFFSYRNTAKRWRLPHTRCYGEGSSFLLGRERVFATSFIKLSVDLSKEVAF